MNTPTMFGIIAELGEYILKYLRLYENNCMVAPKKIEWNPLSIHCLTNLCNLE